jgi:DNA repair exonuclease SbcCD ATPase subunit
MAAEHSEINTPEKSAQKVTNPAQEPATDPVLGTFAELIGDMSLDLARSTFGPALASMHADWRKEAADFQRETAEWISRVNASRQQMDQALQKQHALSQEVYSTHAKLLDEMAAFQKERRDALQWQEEVSASLKRLSELHRELSLESTRIAGVVRDIISELARYQNDTEKRFDLFERTVAEQLEANAQKVQQQLQATQESMQEALESLSKTDEETRAALTRDLMALRREVQEVATRTSRDMVENRAALQQSGDEHFRHFEQTTRSMNVRMLVVLLIGELIIIAGLLYQLY